MGRKPNAAAMSEERAHMPESTNTSLGGAKLQPESTNPSVERAELQHENTNISLERAKLQPKIQANSAKLYSGKKTKKHIANARLRRSERLQNTVTPAVNQEIERVIEEVTLSESEKEDEPPTHKEEKLPESTFNEKTWEENFDYLVRLLEKQQKTIEALMSQATKNSFCSESSFVADVKYKSLYIDSQKKIEALTDEKHQLTVKLELAHGKLEAYEKGTRACTEVLEKLKDVILVSNIAKATETAVNVSSQAIRNALDTGNEARTSPAKRKRLAKESKN